MVSNRSGVLQYVNPAWIKTYGYTPEEAIGETPRLLRSNMQSDEFYSEMWRQILDPEIGLWKGEVVNRAKDGRLVPVLLTITPYKENGETVGYMAIAVDLTERRSMERQILRQDRLASVGMLASSLAHEIGNPLGIIRGRAEILKETAKQALSTDAFQGLNLGLDTIVGQIDRISRLIEALLKISRVPQEISLRSVRIAPIVSEVETLLTENCRRKGIKFENLVSRHAPDAAVLADTHHLQQILLNLAINSIHAIDDERKRSGRTEHTITVDLQRCKETDNWCLIVQDSGCGFTAETKRRMFEPFFTTKAPGQGTGLGLAIVSRLCEEMQGHIAAESGGPGLGAKMTVQVKSSSPVSP
jgi:PAS domain S-box-containing protein